MDGDERDGSIRIFAPSPSVLITTTRSPLLTFGDTGPPGVAIGTSTFVEVLSVGEGPIVAVGSGGSVGTEMVDVGVGGLPRQALPIKPSAATIKSLRMYNVPSIPGTNRVHILTERLSLFTHVVVPASRTGGQEKE